MYSIGVDLGGTNIAVGLVDKAGAILQTAIFKTEISKGIEELFGQIVDAVKACAEKAGIGLSEVSCVGIGSPGIMDHKNGVLIYSCNIPFERAEVNQLLQSKLLVPVYIENDADCAALAEALYGAARGYGHSVTITLGTGLGLGVIKGGRVVRGIYSIGCEMGHTVIEVDGAPCPCGRLGCWEAYSSASGLKRMTREALLKNKSSIMWELIGNTTENISGRTAFTAARLGDQTAVGVTRAYIKYLAAGVTNVINTMHPDIICLGGGVSNEEDDALLLPLIEIVDRERYAKAFPMPVITKAKLGNEAGIVGAAMLKAVEDRQRI